MALSLQISPRILEDGCETSASSLMVVYAQDTQELEPLVVLFSVVHIFLRAPYFHSPSTENGKIPSFHPDSRKMTSLEVQIYATEQMPSVAGFASQNGNPYFRINLKSISGIEEWGGLMRSIQA